MANMATTLHSLQPRKDQHQRPRKLSLGAFIETARTIWTCRYTALSCDRVDVEPHNRPVHTPANLQERLSASKLESDERLKWPETTRSVRGECAPILHRPIMRGRFATLWTLLVLIVILDRVQVWDRSLPRLLETCLSLGGLEIPQMFWLLRSWQGQTHAVRGLPQGNLRLAVRTRLGCWLWIVWAIFVHEIMLQRHVAIPTSTRVPLLPLL